MSNEKRFTVAGTSTVNGQSKVRFANDLAVRVKTLAKGGHTNIQLITLPTEMTKAEAVEYLQTTGVTINPDIDLTAVGNKQATAAVKTKAAAVKIALKTGAKKTPAVKPAAKTIKTVGTKTPKTPKTVEPEVEAVAVTV